MKIRYALITAARDEDMYIEKTIRSVISQIILPEKWVIVSDGSIDHTDEIVSRYTAKNKFIILIHTNKHNTRNFTSKVDAIKTGYARLKDSQYDFLGILDADVSFAPNYYECVIQEFQKNPKLGIAGGLISDVCDGKCIQWLTRLGSSVGGPIQMFRRQCYEDIGGLKPLEQGGEDAVAEFMARMHGWEVTTFPNVKVSHYRRIGTQGRSIWHARFIFGVREYLIGYHPIFEIAKCIRRVVQSPYVIGSLLWLIGYFWASLRRYKRTLSQDIIKFIRNEQISLLRGPFSAIKGLKRDK
jgi:glycosyltransferase involved in cell wall biosynthesis